MKTVIVLMSGTSVAHASAIRFGCDTEVRVPTASPCSDPLSVDAGSFKNVDLPGYAQFLLQPAHPWFGESPSETTLEANADPAPMFPKKNNPEEQRLTTTALGSIASSDATSSTRRSRSGARAADAGSGAGGGGGASLGPKRLPRNAGAGDGSQAGASESTNRLCGATPDRNCGASGGAAGAGGGAAGVGAAGVGAVGGTDDSRTDRSHTQSFNPYDASKVEQEMESALRTSSCSAADGVVLAYGCGVSVADADLLRHTDNVLPESHNVLPGLNGTPGTAGQPTSGNLANSREVSSPTLPVYNPLAEGEDHDWLASCQNSVAPADCARRLLDAPETGANGSQVGVTDVPVPEAGSLVLLGTGLLALGLSVNGRRRHRLRASRSDVGH